MLRIEMESWSGEKYYAVYDHFRIDGARQHYRLHISGYRGNAGDAMNSVWENHDGRPFSTKDKDNDERYYDSCAQHYQGAWWFNNCFEAHLNGKYYTKGFHKNYFQRDGIQWNTIHMYSSLKAVQMMVKPVDKPAKTG
ncbi:angiopoietin-related protein 1 [Plakobranchus ocellatus]|uniref:Angiopoietin-related protein 1 n=1 Tax=Plakobranchus ocellatus TaxID=259542 RepID=A0AAV3Y226_9GAST|nr:angiopoietin-related protein 1 [Plakobranchus ocellatus]